MKRHVFLAMACIICIAVSASPTDTIRPPRPKVGVVLGGGGAKGAGHIGVLKYIEEIGIPVDYVAGTSMGSIIGGMYAMGYTPDELATIIAKIDWSAYIGNSNERTLMSNEVRKRNNTTLFNVPFGAENTNSHDTKQSLINTLPKAYVNNESLINLFNNLCIDYQQDTDFNDLPIPFACVATDLTTGEEVVIRSGSVPTAMRASMAIPGIFSPVTLGNRVLVDGGLVNNFPADVLRDMGADIIIGVEVIKEQQITSSDLQSLPQLMGKLFFNIVNSKRDENHDMCDILIIPDITGYGMLSFTPSAIDTLVNRGYKRASEYHDQLLSIKNHIDKCAGRPIEKELRAQRAKNLETDSIFIRSIILNETSALQSKWLIRKGDLQVGKKIIADDIEKAMKIYRGSGAFDDITYHITKDQTDTTNKGMPEEAYNLSIDFKPAKPHVIGLGLRYDTEEGAGILFSLGLNEKRLSGFKTNLSARISYNPKINVTATYSGLAIASANISYDFHKFSFKHHIDHNPTSLGIESHRLSAYFTQFHLLNLNIAAGTSYTFNMIDHIGAGTLPDTAYFNNRLLSPYFDLCYDNMDDQYFAKHGICMKLNAQVNFDMEKHAKPCEEVSFSFQGNITPHNGRYTIMPQIYARGVMGDIAYLTEYNYIGGHIEGRFLSQQMPFIGIQGTCAAHDLTAILRCDLRYNFFGKHYLTAIYNYMQSMKTDSHEKFHLNGAGLKYSYNSHIGPISLTGQWSDYYYLRNIKDRSTKNGFSVHFSLGYTF